MGFSYPIFFLPSNTRILPHLMTCTSIHFYSVSAALLLQLMHGPTHPINSTALPLCHLSSSSPQHFLAQFLKFTFLHQNAHFHTGLISSSHWDEEEEEEERKSCVVIWSMTVPLAMVVEGTFFLPGTVLVRRPLTAKATTVPHKVLPCSHTL